MDHGRSFCWRRRPAAAAAAAGRAGRACGLQLLGDPRAGLVGAEHVGQDGVQQHPALRTRGRPGGRAAAQLQLHWKDVASTLLRRRPPPPDGRER